MYMKKIHSIRRYSASLVQESLIDSILYTRPKNLVIDKTATINKFFNRIHKYSLETEKSRIDKIVSRYVTLLPKKHGLEEIISQISMKAPNNESEHMIYNSILSSILNRNDTLRYKRVLTLLKTETQADKRIASYLYDQQIQLLLSLTKHWSKDKVKQKTFRSLLHFLLQQSYHDQIKIPFKTLHLASNHCSMVSTFDDEALDLVLKLLLFHHGTINLNVLSRVVRKYTLPGNVDLSKAFRWYMVMLDTAKHHKTSNRTTKYSINDFGELQLAKCTLSLLKLYAKNKDRERLRGLLHSFEEYLNISEARTEVDYKLFTLMINGYTILGEMEKAIKIFQRLQFLISNPEQLMEAIKISIATLVDGFTKINGLQFGYQLYRSIVYEYASDKGVLIPPPDFQTPQLNSLLSELILEERNCIPISIDLFDTILKHFFFKHSHSPEANQILQDLKILGFRESVVTFSTMMNRLLIEKDYDKVASLFKNAAALESSQNEELSEQTRRVQVKYLHSLGPLFFEALGSSGNCDKETLDKVVQVIKSRDQLRVQSNSTKTEFIDKRIWTCVLKLRVKLGDYEGMMQSWKELKKMHLFASEKLNLIMMKKVFPDQLNNFTPEKKRLRAHPGSVESFKLDNASLVVFLRGYQDWTFKMESASSKESLINRLFLELKQVVIHHQLFIMDSYCWIRLLELCIQNDALVHPVYFVDALLNECVNMLKSIHFEQEMNSRHDVYNQITSNIQSDMHSQVISTINRIPIMKFSILVMTLRKKEQANIELIKSIRSKILQIEEAIGQEFTGFKKIFKQ